MNVNDAIRELIDATADEMKEIGEDARDEVENLLAQHEQEIAGWVASGDTGQLSTMRFRVETILRGAQLDAVREARRSLSSTFVFGVRLLIKVLTAV